MGEFENKTVLITGGAQGLGKATALEFSRLGANVVIWDVNESAGKETLEELREFGENAFFNKVDVADFSSVQTGISTIIDRFKRIDVLINNAGIVMDKSLLKMDPATWQKVIDVNLTGVFNCTKAVAPHMVDRGSGVILNASSVVGLYGNFGQTNYVASKAGVIGMTKTWARELGPKGIRVNAVAPGFMQTDMVKDMPESALEMMIQKTPLQRMGTAQDIANAYTFLASEKAAFITGTTLSVDGGLTF